VFATKSPYDSAALRTKKSMPNPRLNEWRPKNFPTIRSNGIPIIIPIRTPHLSTRGISENFFVKNAQVIKRKSWTKITIVKFNHASNILSALYQSKFFKDIYKLYCSVDLNLCGQFSSKKD